MLPFERGPSDATPGAASILSDVLEASQHSLPVHVPTDPVVSGIILAGGRSRRMGFDKLSVEVGGVPMLTRVCVVLGRFCQEIVVVGDGGPEVEGVARIPDSRSGGEGPLAGLEAGLAATDGGVVFACAGDMPFVNEGLARSLLSLVRGGARAAVPVHPAGTWHPLFAAYERGVGREIGEALDAGTRSMRGMLSRVSGAGGVEYVGGGFERFGEPGAMLMNVNSPEDLKAARSMHEARRLSPGGRS